VLQILCLDVLTDQIPALALGIEPPGEDAPHQPPRDQRLLDRALLTRAFGVLGPVEAAVEMAAFATVLWAAGWRPGGDLPDIQTIMAASGAAFSAVVIGQAANAFACRDTQRWAGARGWFTNRLLLIGVGVELGLLVLLLYMPPLATVLGQSPPTLLGWLVAMLAAPAVLLADAVHKRVLAARTRRLSL
jgi:magnesium-transporting ATPase (P-type)